MFGAGAEADAVEKVQGAFAVGTDAAEFSGQKNIFFRVERGDELVGLKDEADFCAAQAGEIVFFQVADFDAVEFDAAGSDGIEAGDQAEQGAFAAAGGAHDGDELGLGHGET